jgi:hypothetical protein
MSYFSVVADKFNDQGCLRHERGAVSLVKPDYGSFWEIKSSGLVSYSLTKRATKVIGANIT